MSRSRTAVVLAWVVLVGSVASGAQAQSRLGGHFGAVIPLATRSGGETTTVGDDFSIGFPTGLTLKKNSRVAFDLELVPVIQNEPLALSLTVHPGGIFSAPRSFAAGVRMAFDVREASWGFTPLLARSFTRNGGAYALFLEVDVPIRFQEDAFGQRRTAVTVAAHAGLGF